MKIIDICGNATAQKNTGAKDQKYLGATKKYILAKENQKFLNKEDFKNKSIWEAFQKEKDIVFFFDVQTVENTSTEATYYESRTNKIPIKEGRKSKKFSHDLGICSYSALKSYENSQYTRVYEITDKGYVTGVANEDGSIQGQKISNFIVEQYKEATFEAIESATVEIIYKDPLALVNNPAIVTPSFEIDEIEGVYDVAFEVISATSSTIIIEANAGCCGHDVSSLELADFKFVSTSGSNQTLSASSYTNGRYTLTGSSLVSGTIATNGVIAQTDIMYEALPTAVTV